MKAPYVVIFLSLILSACKEYKPVIEARVNESKITIEGIESVVAMYVNMGGYYRSSVGGDNGDYAINIRFDANFPSTHNCGEGGSGVIDVFFDGESWSTEYNGGSGTIECVEAGNNLIEGYFNGTLSNGSNTIEVTDGLFSGRVY